MAGKKNNLPNNLIDYYAVFLLDRNLSAKEIKKKLRSIQGDIRENMSSGSLNSEEVLAKLQASFHQVADALKVFKNDETKKKYDAQLDEAYATGALNTEAQKVAEDLYAEIEALFLKGNYQKAAQKCTEALNNNVRDAKIYGLLARSYYALRDVVRSVNTVAEGIKIHPENMELLRIGARFTNEGQGDFNTAQGYINRMFDLDQDNKYAHAEQIYLYLCNDKIDLAYQNIDNYINQHPQDSEFRKLCAYDLIGHSYSYYTKDDTSNSYYIISKEDYENCVDICEKAVSLYNDENTVKNLENAKAYGEIEFNEDNKENIIWTAVAGVLYLFAAIMAFSSASQTGTGIGLLTAIPIVALGVGVLYCAVGLYQVSKRPYWQIYKYYMTGKREKRERIFIIIGNIFGWYIKFSFKLAKWIFKLTFHLAFR